MNCYINKIVSDNQVTSDIKALIPDPIQRRRMSRIIKTAVSTAVECIGGVDNISNIDAIITATGWGCLTDSEKFLRNVIVNKEELLNPTPFIQSTFNTVGGQIALLRNNSCYNVTYVNRSHSFEDAMLDAMIRIAGGESRNVLVGAFDEQTPSQFKIMERMGLFRTENCGEGAVFVNLSPEKNANTMCNLVSIDFPGRSLTASDCIDLYSVAGGSVLLYQDYRNYGLFPTASSFSFQKAAGLISEGEGRVVVYNEYLGGSPSVMILECVG